MSHQPPPSLLHITYRIASTRFSIFDIDYFLGGRAASVTPPMPSMTPPMTPPTCCLQRETNGVQLGVSHAKIKYNLAKRRVVDFKVYLTHSLATTPAAIYV